MFGIEDPWVKARIEFVAERVTALGRRQFDAPLPTGLFLCMTPRSGSTYFGALLRDHGLGEFMERFRVVNGSLERDLANAKAETYYDYVRYKIRRSQRGDTVGFKLDWPQFVPLYYSGAWRDFFGTSKFIYLTRENVLLQAISRYIGEKTGIFHSHHLAEGRKIPDELDLDYEKIEQHLKYIIVMMSAWEKFFAAEGVSPVRLTYEAMLADTPAALQSVAAAVGHTLTSPLVLGNEFEPVSTQLNRRLEAAFIAEYRRRHETAALWPAAAGSTDSA